MFAMIFDFIQSVFYWTFYIVIVGGGILLLLGQQIHDCRIIWGDIKLERAERRARATKAE